MGNLKKLILEIATIDDLDQLVLLEKRLFDPLDSLTRRQIKHFIYSPTSIVAVAKTDRNVIGAAILLKRKGSKVVRLYSLSVNPDFQGQGIAGKLSDYYEAICKRAFFNEIRLEVKKNNTSAIGFYKKRGYQFFAEKKAYYADRQDALRMRKFL